MHRLFVASCAAIALTLPALPARAGVPVVDTAVISNTLQTANNTLQQLQQLTQMREIVGEQLSVLGSVGSTAYDLQSQPGWQGIVSGGGFVESMRDFTPQDLLAASEITMDVAEEEGVFSDIGVARETAEGVLYASVDELNENGTLEPGVAEALRAYRREQRGKSALNSYSMAMMARGQLADAGERTNDLERLVNNAGDLRADVRAGSAIMLATYQELAALRATMTSMLELQATEAISASGGLVSERGGNLADGGAWQQALRRQTGTAGGVE